MVFPGEAVSAEGALTDYQCKANSGNIMHRRFCPVCGTPVFTQSEARPHFLTVSAGTLDDPNLARPAITIWTKMAPSWACIDANLPRYEGQPPPPVLPSK